MDANALKDRLLRGLKGFSPSQMVIIGLLAAVAVVGAVAFLRWVNAPTYTVLLAGLEPKDAAAVTAQLDTDSVPYQLESGGTTVLVPAETVEAERLKLAAAGLPAEKTAAGWGAFDQQGVTSSSFQQQVAYQRAMEGTLGQTLTGIDGVRSATVHLALPEKKVFTEQQQPARASVLLDTTRTLDAGQVDAVTRLVASGVPGLAAEDVSVSDSSGRLLSSDGAGGAQERQAQTALEGELTAKANTMLDQLLGPGRAVVRVTAETDSAKKTVDSEVFDDEKRVVLRENTSEEAYTSPNGAAGGTLTDPQQQQQNATNNYSKEQAGREWGNSRTVTKTEEAGGGIKRLTVAVAVDRNAPNAPTAAEVRDLVANAVGFDATRGDTIAVSTPSFLQAPEPPVEVPPGAAGSATSLAPTVLGGILLVLVALGFLRTVRRGSSKELPAAQVTAALAEAEAQAALPAGAGRDDNEDDEVAALAAGRQLEALPGPRTAADERADLLSLVDENPDEVAQLLRGWLASTGSER